MKLNRIIGILLIGSLMISCSYLQKIKDSIQGKNKIVGPGSEDIVNTDIDSDNKGSDSGSIEGLSTVFFELDSSRLSPEAMETLKKNVEWLNSNPQVTRLELEGHCDPLGSEAYNIGLGQRRAESVKKHLQNTLRISGEKLSIISYGEERLLSETENHLNRRVNFVPIY